MAKFLDEQGVQTLVSNIKEKFDEYGSSISIHPKPNQIIYTTIDGEKITNVIASNNSVISHNYYENAGYGVIEFENDLTEGPCLSGCANLKEAIFPDNVETLANNTFNACFNLQEFIIPDQVKTIPPYCFYQCRSLNHIYIHGNINTIQNNAFQHSGISNIDLNNVKAIGEFAFDNSQLISLDTRNVISIGRYAFMNCNDLVSVYIGSALEGLGTYCFSECSSLSNINFGENTKLPAIPDYCFASCKSLNEVTIPNNIKGFGSGIFNSCPLRSITIHSSELTSYKSAFTQDQGKSTLEYFYTKSSCPLQSIGSGQTVRTVILDTDKVVDCSAVINSLRNYTTIYVSEDLLNTYKNTYPNQAYLFKPITGKLAAENVWTGSEDEYEEITEYDPDVIYYIIDPHPEV